MSRRQHLVALALVWGTLLGCGPAGPPPPPPVNEASATLPNAVEPRTVTGTATRDATSRDLAADETLGGHTLTRHTARTDQQLIERLQRERDISAASTYTDRSTAERIVGAAITASHDQLERWLTRKGPRPNLTLHYRDPDGGAIGRSVRRGRRRTDLCDRALVVLKWDQHRNQYFVLTSYPEARR